MDQLVEHIFVFDGQGNIKNFPGNYTDYREYLAEQEQEEKLATKPNPVSAPAVIAKTESPAKRKASFKEKQEFEQLDQAIQDLEERKAALLTEMNAQQVDHQKIVENAALLKKIENELEVKGERWLELSEIVD
jgi:ATP-binding cassette subfamily F protein uup